MANEDDDALRARVARLEEALQAKQRETESEAALKRRVAELERQVAAKGAAPAPDARAEILRALAARRAVATPNASAAPPRLFDRPTVTASLVIPFVTTVMGAAFLPMLGVGALVESAACPAGSKRSYTKHYRQIVNGNVSDHWEFRCLDASGQDVLGNEGVVYLTGGGIGLALGLVIAAIVVRSRRARLRERRIDAGLDG